jgi:hypothetical protein
MTLLTIIIDMPLEMTLLTIIIDMPLEMTLLTIIIDMPLEMTLLTIIIDMPLEMTLWAAFPFPPPSFCFKAPFLFVNACFTCFTCFTCLACFTCAAGARIARARMMTIYMPQPPFFPPPLFLLFFFSLCSGRSHRSRQDDDNVSVAESRMSDRDVSMEVLYNSALIEP